MTEALPAAGSHSPAADDNALLDAASASFGFDEYVDLLANRLHAVSEPPFTLGIYGTWGAGKTTLMRCLQSRLKANSGMVTVWFDAWKYDREDAIWRALLATVLNAVDGALDREQRKAAAGGGAPPGSLAEARAKLEPIRESLYRTVVHEQPGSLEIDFAKAAKSGLRLLLPMVGGPAATVLMRLLGGKEPTASVFGISDAQAGDVRELLDAVRRESVKQYYEQIEQLDRFHQRLDEVLALAVDSGAGLHRVVVFIDDLDRCLPEKVVQVFEAVKLFLASRHCLFVVGLDDEVVHRAVARHYQHADGGREERQFRVEYLEKVVQLPFRIPPPAEDAVHAFVERNYRHARQRDQVIPLLALGCEPNPRKLKRLCWTLDLQMALADRRGIDESIHPEVLAKLAVIQHRHPELYRHLCAPRRSATAAFLERLCSEQSRRDAKSRPDGTPGRDEKRGPPIAERERDAPEQASLRQYLGANEWLRTLLAWRPDAGEFMTFERLGAGILVHLQFMAVTAGRGDEVSAVPERVDSDRMDEQRLAGLLDPDRVIAESAFNELPRDWHTRYCSRVFEMFTLPDTEWRQRVAAGDALALLGDPRFEDEMPSRDAAHWKGIAEGEFYYGSPKDDELRFGDEDEQHIESIDVGYELAVYPVTNSEYAHYVASTGTKPPEHWQGSTPPGRLANHPVVQVSWDDATAYCRWLTQAAKDGYRYALPTEWQWERGARGPRVVDGHENRRRWPWGDEFDAGRANTEESELGRTSAVGSFPLGASRDGLLDMAGNVYEWCSDELDKGRRLVRGGCFVNGRRYVRCSDRGGGDHPGHRGGLVGFRLTRTRQA